MTNKFFFSHDFDARNDLKIINLRAEYGWEGYGIFWALCETIAENDNPIPIDNINGLSFILGVEKTFLSTFIKFCIDEDLFIEVDNSITSKSLEERLEHKREKSRKAKESAERRWKNANKKHLESDDNANALQTQSDSNANLMQTKTKTKTKTKQKTISKDIVVEAKASPKSKEERKVRFYEDIVEIVGGDYDIYPKDQLKRFFEYWSESGSRDRKMKFEKQKSFDVKLRLKTWLEKNEEWKKDKNNDMRGLSFAEQDRLRTQENLRKIREFKESTQYNLIEG